MTRGTVTVKQIVGGICLLALVSGVLAIGFLSGGDPGQGTPQQIGANASERYDAIEGINATRTRVVERGGRTSHVVHQVSVRPGTEKVRSRYLRGDEPRFDLVVSNGSEMWWYNAEANKVTTFPLTGSPHRSPGTRGDRIEALFDRLNVTETGTETAVDPTPGINPLPAVPQPGGRPVGDTTAKDENASYGVSYDGTATVDDREVYVLHVRPRSDASTTYEQTLWVDAERFFPVKQRTQWTDEGQRVTMTTTYRNVTFDPGLDRSVFRFDPAANATVERPKTPRVETYRTVNALRTDTTMPVPDPEVPPALELTYASKTTGRVNGTSLQYANATAWLSVATTNWPVNETASRDRTIRIDGREAGVFLDVTSSVAWTCQTDGTVWGYKVRGQGVPSDLLIEVARSVGCE